MNNPINTHLVKTGKTGWCEITILYFIFVN
ncbi:hypothetical protein BH11VER1_BH11VER1_14230 [soil metagenome]